MTKNTTYQELLALERDIYKQSQNSPAFAAFSAQKIKSFFSLNKARLDSARNDMEEIFRKHINRNDDGSWKQVTKDGDQAAWDFISKEDEAEFKIEYELLVSKPCTINL